MRTTLSVLATSLLLAGLPAAARAQAPTALPGGVKTAVRVTAMDLDVVAERKGVPVTDLGREEFRVALDGKPVVLDYFARIDAGTVHGPDLATASPDVILETLKADDGSRYLPRQFLVFFDDEHLLPFDRDRLVEGLRDFVTRLTPSDRVAIWSYNVTPRVLVPFTNSKEDLLAALSKLLTVAPHGLSWQAQFRTTVSDVRRTPPYRRPPIIRAWSQQVMSREQATLDELRRAVAALSARSGRRLLLFLSRGLELHPGQSLTQALGPSQLQQFDFSVTDGYRAVVSEANRSGVTIDSIDARGLSVDADASESEPSPFDAFFTSQNLREALAGLAGETGGVLVENRNFFKASLEKIYREASTYYSLGVTVGGTPPPAKGWSVKVSTTRPGVTVRARSAWAEKPVEEIARDRIEMALVTPDALGDFPVSLQTGSAKKAGGLGGKRLLPFTVRVPATSLTFERTTSGRKASIEILLAAVEDDGSKSPVSTVKVPIEVPEGKWEAALKEAFAYSGEMKTRKGNLRFVAGVRDVPTGRLGLTATAVRVE